MQRKLIEKITASLAVTLITFFTVGVILVIANFTFKWDLFPPYTEQLLYFVGAATFVLILGSAFINMMINISRLAFFAEKIAEKITETKSR